MLQVPGQYYLIVNLDKEEYIRPYKFGNGWKFLEFGRSSDGIMTGLVILLANGNNRGGGDLYSNNPIIGSWAGDRIVVTGDYAEPFKFIPEEYKDKLYQKCFKEQSGYNVTLETKEEYARSNCNLFSLASYFFTDISEKVIEAMAKDDFLKKELLKKNILKSEKK